MINEKNLILSPLILLNSKGRFFSIFHFNMTDMTIMKSPLTHIYEGRNLSL